MRIARLLLPLWFAGSVFAAEPVTVKLWPEGTPGGLAPVSEATKKLIASYGKPGPNRVSDVSDPTLTIYRPDRANGACVIVAPGGGYMFLSYVHEGTQVCEWLNSIGVTAALLKYRCPTRDDADVFQKPVQDGQRAIGMVRHHAVEWGIDPKRVGLLGFSAGGNLLGHVACDRSERTYPQKSEYDADARPDFGIMIYGGGFLDANDKARFRAGFSVPQDAPPMFFAVAHDDKSNPVEAARMYLEYKKLGIPAELHVFTHGGHGFGMRRDGHPINDWPQRCAEWMSSMGLLK